MGGDGSGESNGSHDFRQGASSISESNELISLAKQSQILFLACDLDDETERHRDGERE